MRRGQPGLPFFPYARTTWKERSANFAFHDFYELRLFGVLRSWSVRFSGKFTFLTYFSEAAEDSPRGVEGRFDRSN